METTNDNWGTFSLTGKVYVNPYTFKIDQRSKISDYIYNYMSLVVDCGEEDGRVVVTMAGGYFPNNEKPIKAYCKNADGLSKVIEVDWHDRFDEYILNEIADESFITVGLHETRDFYTFETKLRYKKFLSGYDAVAYIKQHLTDGMVVDIEGDVRMFVYMDRVQTDMYVKKIVLHKPEYSLTIKKNKRKPI